MQSPQPRVWFSSLLGCSSAVHSAHWRIPARSSLQRAGRAARAPHEMRMQWKAAAMPCKQAQRRPPTLTQPGQQGPGAGPPGAEILALPGGVQSGKRLAGGVGSPICVIDLACSAGAVPGVASSLAPAAAACHGYPCPALGVFAAWSACLAKHGEGAWLARSVASRRHLPVRSAHTALPAMLASSFPPKPTCGVAGRGRGVAAMALGSGTRRARPTPCSASQACTTPRAAAAGPKRVQRSPGV